jgi:hypothetical protein
MRARTHIRAGTEEAKHKLRFEVGYDKVVLGE